MKLGMEMKLVFSPADDLGCQAFDILPVPEILQGEGRTESQRGV